MFTASNGLKLDEKGRYRGGVGTDKDLHEARIEFYQHLRDEELGRWRGSGFRNWVAYHQEDRDTVRLLLEVKGTSWFHRRDETSQDSPGALVAKAYFEAHPVRKPWHDAKPGESWVLTFEDGTQEAQTVNRDGDFYPWVLPVEIDRVEGRGTITDGRRIWPEKSDA